MQTNANKYKQMQTNQTNVNKCKQMQNANKYKQMLTNKNKQPKNSDNKENQPTTNH